MNSPDFHLKKADYQLRRALSRLMRQEPQNGEAITGMGMTIAALRRVRDVLAESEKANPSSPVEAGTQA